MDQLRFTASARLAVWDSWPARQEEFLRDLRSLDREFSHGVVEVEGEEFDFRSEGALASLLAVLHKIVARGNPTVVDYDFEDYLLRGPAADLLPAEVIADGPVVGHQFRGGTPGWATNELLDAGRELLTLPMEVPEGWRWIRRPLPPHLKALSSSEEDLFEAKVLEQLGPWVGVHLHRQVPIRDLVTDAPQDIAGGRVDFALHFGDLRCVFEVDGEQHQDEGQLQTDRKRDKVLRDHHWKVFRIPAAQAREGFSQWWDDVGVKLRDELSPLVNALPVQKIVAQSDRHRAAYLTILAPLAVQRCLRALLSLYSFGILNPQRSQRILLLEEDLPVALEAFRQLKVLWSAIHTLAPDTPSPPSWEIDVLGPDPLHARDVNFTTSRPAHPQGKYDLVLSHSFFLPEGAIGPRESSLADAGLRPLVRIRRAVGLAEERALQWSDRLSYDLADLEQALSQAQPVPLDAVVEQKRQALRFFLQLLFRKRDFWDGQLRAISRTLQGKPSIVLLPTGGGKSLIYQLSSMLLPGLTLVVDPLVSLMSDQADNLKSVGIDMVGFISSLLEAEEKEANLQDLQGGRLAFVFVAPERLQMREFREQLQSIVSHLPVSLAVIDEAHCVSEWGHDFRPSYLHMPQNLKRFCASPSGETPTILSLTGTASFAVLADIQVEMGITEESAIILPRSFDRKELVFYVRAVKASGRLAALKSLKQELPYLLKSNPMSFYNHQGARTNCGIVFCPHVNGSFGVVEIARELGHQHYFAGEKPKAFPGDHSQWKRFKNEIQSKFKKNQIQEIVATKSFGMGIDKPNIRYTIHYTIPHSVEAFYQEAGRAGRNGQPQYALCAVMYSDENWPAALEILNEPDHPRAVQKLNAIAWDKRGDILIQLWLLLNSYGGRKEEKELTLRLWQDRLAPAVAGRPVGFVNTVHLAMGKSDADRTRTERGIFRLMLLGVVEDYTVDWRTRRFEIGVRAVRGRDIKSYLEGYLRKYKFPDYVSAAISKIAEEPLQRSLRDAVEVLIDFIYDEIVAKRKQALRTMAELCRSFRSDQEFREAILAYLQESEFSSELREWLRRDFDAIGLEGIRALLRRVTTLEEAKRLVGTTRRMLDEDPQNLAIRYLSVCARAQSAVESDGSVLEEVKTWALHLERVEGDEAKRTRLILGLLSDLGERRPSLVALAGGILLRRLGTRHLARGLLQSPFSADQTIRGKAILILASNSLKVIEEGGFYRGLFEKGAGDV